MSDVPKEWIEAFGQGWRSVPAGEPGDRRRAGLAAVIPLIQAAERKRIIIGVTDLPDALTGEQDSRKIPTVVNTDEVLGIIDPQWQR